MAEFRLGRLKFNWRGAWAASTAYVIDDIVRYGANSYVCTGNHTSDSASNGFPSDSAYWSLHTGGIENAGTWTPSTAYVVDDIVQEGGNLYICTSQHTSIGVPSSWYTSDFPSYWELFHEGVSFKGAFTTDTYYGINAIVSYGPYQYRCTSPFQVPADYTMQGISTSQHDQAGIGSDGFYPPSANFATFSQGFENRLKYGATTRYERGDIVEYDGAAYVAIGTNPYAQTPAENTDQWALLIGGIGTGGAGTYSPSQSYSRGETVTLGGNTYIADETLIGPNNRPVGLAITSNDTGTNGWSLAVRGQKWNGTYSATDMYEIGDLVEYSSSAYVSVASSNIGVTPGTAVTMWQAFAIGDSAALLTTKGDILTRNATGPTRQGIGTQGTFLRVSSSDEVEWQYPGIRTKIYYVDAQQGSNANVGYTPDAAWGTIAYASTAAQIQRDITNFVYDESTGIATVTAAAHGLFPNSEIKLSGIAFTCASAHSGVTTTIFPDGTQGFFFTVDSVTDSDTFVTNVGISTIAHDYVSGGKVTDTSPVILKLSAGVFKEQLPITLPKNFNIAGDVLRGTTVEPADGLSTDGVTPNARQTMFFVSDSVTVQAITMRGLQGFAYDSNDPFNTDLWQVKTGIGTTACGVYFRLNPETPILDRSPYIKDCTAFSNVCTDGTGHGGAIGVFIEGGVHEPKQSAEGRGGKSMVFDAFTNINSDGVGFFLEDDALSEIVSSFTYYCSFGYVSDDGSEIRSLSGNNSYGDYGAIACGFSTLETARTGRLFGDKLELVVGQVAGTLSVGATMRGTVSGARAVLTNDQQSGEQIYFKYDSGFGNPDGANGAVGVGTTVFVPGEYVETDSVGAGATGRFQIKSTSNAVSGQKDILFEITGLSTTPKVGDALGFTTVGMGYSDTTTYIIRTVTNYDSGTGRATINIAPGKGSAPASFDDQEFTMRTNFSKVRLTGHDFLLIGTGNTSETNYPNVNENNASQGNETNVERSGKIFFVSTDQGGNFRVGDFFSVNQLTGAATLDASAFNLSGLTELRLGAIGGQVGEAINEFSSDETLAGDSNTAAPTEKAVRGFLTRGKMDATSGILVPPRGAQASRPTGVDLLEGGLRYDTDANGFEFYNGTAWLPLGAYANVDATGAITLANRQQAFCNTSGGAFTVTLPASPVKGDSVRIFDVADTFDSNNLTINRNGNPIMGDASDMVVSTEGAAFELVFYDGTQGWRIITI